MSCIVHLKVSVTARAIRYYTDREDGDSPLEQESTIFLCLLGESLDLQRLFKALILFEFPSTKMAVVEG